MQEARNEMKSEGIHAPAKQLTAILWSPRAGSGRSCRSFVGLVQGFSSIKASPNLF